MKQARANARAIWQLFNCNETGKGKGGQFCNCQKIGQENKMEVRSQLDGKHI